MTEKKKKTSSKKPASGKAKKTSSKKMAGKQKAASAKSSSVKTKKSDRKKTSDQKSSVQKTKTSKKRGKRTKKKAVEVEGPSPEEIKQWKSLSEQHKGEKATPYNMKKSFDSIPSIEHKNFGQGFIISQYNNRLKVLFKDGVKVLISNYQD